MAVHAGRADGARLRPWICLMVVADNDGIVLDVRPGGPAVLNLNKSVAELPDLANVDAWAHAQVVGGGLSGDALNAALDADDGARLGRLVCPRKLEPNGRYLACIVPTYRAGVECGFGQPGGRAGSGARVGSASTTAPFQLPVYYYFRFQTGPGGDFASLASRITPPAVPLDAGKRSVDISAPGFGAAAAPDVTLGFEGALRAQGEPPGDWPTGAQTPYEAQLRQALAPVAGADPVVAPPVYGRTQSGKDLPSGHDAPVWLGDLNLDPRMRAAAAAGAQVVQRDQEALVASAWDQLGEIRKANQLLRQAQLARGASASMLRRHLGAIAADGAYLQITRPLHSRVSFTLGGVTFTLRGHVAASRLPARSLSAAMRKLARPRGALGRQLGTGKPPQLVDRLNLPASAGPTALTAAGPVQPPRGMVALDDVSPDIQVAKMANCDSGQCAWLDHDCGLVPGVLSSGAASVASSGVHTNVGGTATSDLHAAVYRAGADTGPGGATSARLIDWNNDPDVPAVLKGAHANLPAPLQFPTDAAALKKMAHDFSTVAGPVNVYLNTAPAPPPDPPSLGGSATLAPARTQLQARLDPERTITARFGARIPLGAGQDPLQPLRIAPQFPQPMYAPLADISAAWMLPGADKVPPNAAVLLQTNPRFVEAFMVGLNEAMAAELLWREFPVGRTATYFQNFWGGAAPDIPTIDTFAGDGKLGDHTADHATGGNLVLLIRADLFRRYPNTMVSAVQAQWGADGKTRKLGDTRKWPLFRGTIGTDLNFFGFDVVDARGVDSAAAGTNAGWYFVLEEHVTEPRFGLEPETSSPQGSSWNDLSWSYAKLDRSAFNLDPVSTPTPHNGAWGQGEPAAWGQGAAAMAYILMRRPVRVAMHGRALLAAAGT